MFIHPDQLGEQTYLRPYIQSPLSPVHSVSSLKGRYAHPMGHLVRPEKIQIVVLFTKEPHGISSKVKVMTLTHITISVEDFSELNGSSDFFVCFYITIIMIIIIIICKIYLYNCKLTQVTK